jgi:hypothetical protein
MSSRPGCIPNVIPLDPGIGPRSELIEPGVDMLPVPKSKPLSSIVGACARTRARPSDSNTKATAILRPQQRLDMPLRSLFVVPDRSNFSPGATAPRANRKLDGGSAGFIGLTQNPS